MAGTLNHELMPLCKGCGKQIDTEWCWCGSSVASHGMGDGHSPVPMGCECFYPSTVGMPTTAEAHPPQPAHPLFDAAKSAPRDGVARSGSWSTRGVTWSWTSVRTAL